MKYLLDTVTLLWFAFDNRDKFSTKALDILVKSEGEFLLSAASTWETSIKYSLGRLQLSIPPEQFILEATVKMKLAHLPITSQHTLQTINLPFHHKDPFDRLLIAQAQIENIPILTPDEVFKKYQIDVVW